MLDFLNITNNSGEVATLFGGKVTVSQLISILVTVIIVCIILTVVKKAIKTVLCIGVVCACLVYFGIASPAQIKDVASKVTEAGIESYQSIAEKSKNIKIEDSTIKVCIDDKWFDVADITSIVGDGSGNATVSVDGETHVTNDSVVIELLKSFA